MNLDISTRQIFIGNILMIACCVFYLIWWLVAFNPDHPIKGMKSGWLLIPAFIFGLIGIIWVILGCGSKDIQISLFPKNAILIGGIILYIILLVLTSVLLKRQVTTELLLIVGWLVLMFMELNALYGLGQYGRSGTIIFMIVMVIAAAVSIICYLLYYNLDSVKGYVDGMIPLLIGAVMMAVIDVSLITSHG